MANRHGDGNEKVKDSVCKKYLTNNGGAFISDDQNSKTIGSNGPVLLEDVNLIEKIAHFDRERIPERVVHAKGAGAHGYFKCYKCMKEYTCANFLQDPKKKTEVFVRFSTVIGSKGSADTVRDPRGFAVKFYTDEGNYDIAVKDLRDAIEKGDYPKYELCVQMMDIDEACNLYFDPLDDTKTWPEDKFPLIKVGMMTLDRNPENFFTEVEQSAFCPGNVVRGVELSADKMLQGRGFSYTDTQRYRIGTNFLELPINRPKCHVNNNLQDGTMRYKNKKGPINYKPNSLNNNEPLEYPNDNNCGLYVKGNITKEGIKKPENFRQAGERYRTLSNKQKDALVDNILSELWEVPKDISDKVIEYFTKADKDFGMRVRMGLKC
ncbi:MAG: catalase [Clostridium sp.]|nr:catalase [Clostridium sp.]